MYAEFVVMTLYHLQQLMGVVWPHTQRLSINMGAVCGAGVISPKHKSRLPSKSSCVNVSLASVRSERETIRDNKWKYEIYFNIYIFTPSTRQRQGFRMIYPCCVGLLHRRDIP